MNRNLLIVFLIVLVMGAIVLVTRSHPRPAMPTPIPPPTPAQPFERRNSLSLALVNEANGAVPREGNEMVKLYVNGTGTPWKWQEEIPVPLDATVRLVATPAPGFYFVRWTGLLHSVALKDATQSEALPPDGTSVQPDISFSFEEGTCSIRAVFSYRPGSDDIDLVADFRIFLKECGLASSDAEMEAFDTGGDSPYREDGVVESPGDGFPDIVLFALVNRLLHQPPVELGSDGGVCSASVWKEYSKNLEIVERSLPMASPSVRRAVTVYALLGYESQLWVYQVVNGTYSIDLRQASLTYTASRWLTADANAENDHMWNGEEWKAVLAACPADASLDTKIKAFLTLALDIDNKDSNPASPPISPWLPFPLLPAP